MKSVLFKSEMTAAILAEDPDYQKTMTRRPLKIQPPESCGKIEGPGLFSPTILDPQGEQQPGPEVYGVYSEDGEWGLKFPYGRPGKVVYVKETYWAWGFWLHEYDAKKGRKAWRFIDRTRDSGRSYRFEQPDQPPGQLGNRLDYGPAWHKRPSLFMPAHASRIQLKIEDVRVERLQEISEADALAEGVSGEQEAADAGLTWYDKPRRAFRFLWQSINGANRWDANPLVWVITFKRLEDTDERYQRIAS